MYALREEGDFCCSRERMMPITFLSTPSVRRATVGLGIHGVRIVISIHALREEGDSPPLLKSSNFQPFLSTPSARRATCHPRCVM